MRARPYYILLHSFSWRHLSQCVPYRLSVYYFLSCLQNVAYFLLIHPSRCIIYIVLSSAAVFLPTRAGLRERRQRICDHWILRVLQIYLIVPAILLASVCRLWMMKCDLVATSSYRHFGQTLERLHAWCKKKLQENNTKEAINADVIGIAESQMKRFFETAN